MIKLFATDLDGTLLARAHRADEFIDEMVHKVFDQGKYFTIATGRNANRATPEELTRPVYHICMNGAVITGLDDELLYYDSLNRDVLKAILEELPEYDFDFMDLEKTYKRTSKETWIENHKHMRPPKRSLAPGEEMDENWHQEMMADLLEKTVFDQTMEDILSKDICKINLHCRHKKIDCSHLDQFLEKYQDLIQNCPCDNGIYELTNVGTDKGSAVLKLADMLNVNKDEVATYGDGGNDAPMLTLFEHSYAPSNGLEEVKECAKHIIGPHYEHSVTKHILQTLEEN